MLRAGRESLPPLNFTALFIYPLRGTQFHHRRLGEPLWCTKQTFARPAKRKHGMLFLPPVAMWQALSHGGEFEDEPGGLCSLWFSVSGCPPHRLGCCVSILKQEIQRGDLNVFLEYSILELETHSN